VNIQSAGDAGAIYCTGLIVYVVIDLAKKFGTCIKANKREPQEILSFRFNDDISDEL
jgi:hypothetical protein